MPSLCLVLALTNSATVDAICANCFVWSGHIDAVLHGEQLFVGGAGYAVPAALTGTSSFLFRGRYDWRRRNEPIEALRPDFGNYSSVDRHRVQIKDDTLLSSHKRLYLIPVEELDCVEPGPFGARVYELRHKRERAEGDTAAWYSASPLFLLFPAHRPPDRDPPKYTDGYTLSVALARGDDDVVRNIRQLRYTAEGNYDVRLAGKDRVRLYHAFDGKLVVSTELVHFNRNLNKPEAKAADRPARDLRTGKLPDGFRGAFSVHESGDAVYLLTRPDSRLFRLVPTGKEGLEITEVWKADRLTVLGVVADNETGKSHLFGHLGRRDKPERFFLELSAKPNRIDYKIAFTPKVEQEDAFREVYDCVDAVRNANKTEK